MAIDWKTRLVKDSFFEGFVDGCLYGVVIIAILVGTLLIVTALINAPGLLLIIVPMLATGLIVGCWRAYKEWRIWSE